MYEKDRGMNITAQIAALLKAYEPIFNDAPEDIRMRFSQLTQDAIRLNIDIFRSLKEDNDDTRITDV